MQDGKYKLAPYSRRLQSVVNGKMLKSFDEICAKRQLNESEAVREGIRLLIDKYGAITTNKGL